jgi:hypothetical protein
MDNYYRKITELSPKKVKLVSKTATKHLKSGLRRDNLIFHLAHFSIMMMAVLAIFLSYYLSLSYVSFIQVSKERSEAMDSLVYWEGIIREHPNLPDGLYNAALYAAILGDKDKSASFLDKALALDPDFRDAIELEKIISN